MRIIDGIYKDMLEQKIKGIAVNKNGDTKFFLENGISFKIDEMELEK